MRYFWITILLAIASAGCKDMQSNAQDWVLSAPEKSAVGISCHLGWMLETPELRKAITSYPMFGQALELFLDKAQIDPSSETGRVSAYILKFPSLDNSGHLDAPSGSLREMALMQVAGFRDHKAIQRVIVESFPPEGSLKLGGREYPLFVVLDVNSIQIRILSDGDGRLWIGDIVAFQELAKKRRIGEGGPISRAFQWIAPSGAMQGFVQPELMPKGLFKGFADMAPVGIKGLAWSMSPSRNGEQIIDLDLVVTGTEDAIAELKPWIQRLVAMVSSLAGDGARQPETVQENGRMGIRCHFRQDQLGDALEMINLQAIAGIPASVVSPAPDKAK